MVDEPLHFVAIGLGSNKGDRLASLRAARLALEPYIKIEGVSPVFEAAPAYATDQPLFLNAAMVGHTTLEPLPLLYTLKKIERDLGRMPTFHYGPRVIDLDLLFYDGIQLHTSELTVPHPRMEERSFVLKPLVKIAPDWVHPSLLKSVAELSEALPGLQDLRELEEMF